MSGVDEQWQTLRRGPLGVQANTLLLFELDAPAEVGLDEPRGVVSKLALEGGTWLLAVAGKYTLAIAPGTAYKRVAVSSACTLLAFLDTAGATASCDERQAASATRVLTAVPKAVGESSKAFECWLLQHSLTSPRSLLLHWLRAQEAYSLVHYLLNNYCASGQLKDLCEKYGVSYSHFRKLCRDFLGMPAKTKLREWRAAKSVLDIVEGRGSILEVALSNGYASASHIANDIKREFGLKPTMFAKAEQLLLLKELGHEH